MSLFKCKMCGGTLEIENNATVAECEYCGTRQTLPKLDDEKRANMYDRANHFRRNNEFDKAIGIYEQILNEDNTDAEAYWSLVLCRYGIEYVEDPSSHKRIPTVNRAQFTSVYDDGNYRSALQYADIMQKAVYEAEADAINEIQKGILAISQKEEPFDVFICYKETDAGGRRTPDSVLANDLYHQLTQEGFKVFFSRITLEDKLGSAYEPYIFAALNSAKVMVVLGTKAEYFSAVWVKNEWSRYLALIRQGDKKVLIPAYKDMDPYDLPEEFSHLQAQDMSKLGFMQDLIRGIKKLAGEDKPKTAEPVAAEPSAGVNLSSLIKRAYMFLDDGEWAGADGCAEKILDADPESGEAYLIKLLAELKLKRKEELQSTKTLFTSHPNYTKAYRYADEELAGFLSDASKKQKMTVVPAIYELACELYRSREDDMVRQAKEKFESIIGYEDSRRYAVACDEFFIKKQEESSRKRTKMIFMIASSVIAVIGIICAIVLPDPIRNARIYKQGNKYIDSGIYESAMTELEKLPEDYKDVAKLITECGYLKALDDIEEKQYQRAIEFFGANLDYKDCDERYKEAKYQYVNRWKDRNNETTYQYLKDLKSIGYKDTAEIFEDLYAWEVTLDYCNTDSEDYDTTLDSIPTTTDYLHMQFILSGGEPGEVITVGHTTHWPGKDASESSWYWEDRSDGDYLGIEWAKGVSSNYGTMTIEFYKDDGTFIDRISFSVKDVEAQNG